MQTQAMSSVSPGIVAGEVQPQLADRDRDRELATKDESQHTSTGSNSRNVDNRENVETVGSVNPRSKSKWSRWLNPLRMQKIPPVPEQRSNSPEYGAGVFSKITFQWMAPLMHVGYLRPIAFQDIWSVNPDRAVDPLKEKFNSSYRRRLNGKQDYPLLFALYETFKFEIWMGGICQLFSSLLLVLTPLAMRFLINAYTEVYTAKHNNLPSPGIGKGIGIVIGISCSQILQSLGNNQFLYNGMVVGGQAKAVLTSVIFDKSLKVSSRAKVEVNEVGTVVSKAVGGGSNRGWSNGKILTLVSVDVERINLAFGMLHILWTAPVTIMLTLIILVINISYSALAGYALLVIGIPLLAYAIRSLVKRRKFINKLTDQRVSLTQEILQNMRILKFLGWENSFLQRLNGIRDSEIKGIQLLLAIRNAILCVSLSLPVFASMLSFITYSLSNHALIPARIFASLSLFNSLRNPLNLLPQVISQVADAWTAHNRIQDFLLAEEQRDDIKFNESMREGIELNHASFTWERSLSNEGGTKTPAELRSQEAVQFEKATCQEKPGDTDTNSQGSDLEPYKLSGLTFSVGRNELLAVIGPVGAGKSSLLSGLAGEMRLVGGEVVIGASRAYCPQQAWIQSNTVRNNILFGKEYEETWYNQVVNACALKADFDMFPDGDETEVGERGITLSGGQKQRLDIARAIYSKADILLLDDPLSAVDAHVGRHVMNEAVCGLLKDKCRILATHQLNVLNRCDRIILLDNGRINAIDTFENLMRDNQIFQQLMLTTTKEKEQQRQDLKQGATKDKNQIVKASKNTMPAKGLLIQKGTPLNSAGSKVWMAYISASGSSVYMLILIVAIIAVNGANLMTNLWLAYWTSRKWDLSNGQYIGLYAGLATAQVIFMYTFALVLATAGTNASKTILLKALTRVFRAPMSFFDTTPTGHITDRLSKDIQVMDNDLTDAIRTFAVTITTVISALILIILFYYYFLIALCPLAILFYLASNYYRASASDIKRYEALLRSRVFARFSEAISGTACIRAYGLQTQFSRNICEAIDDMDGAYFLTMANQRWLSVRLNSVGTAMVLVTGVMIMTTRYSVSPSIAGLVLSYVLMIVQTLQFTIRQLADVENKMNATERLHNYATQLVQEAPHQLGYNGVPPNWPQEGRITFSDVQMRHRSGLPLALRGLNLDIRGGECIGIVGRTGAGKSSILSALFRICELSSGSIKIDGVDIATVDLPVLRSSFAIIPQDATLFRGTVRSNLDPFEKHTDLELWSALRKVHLVGQNPNDEAALKGHAKESSQSSIQIHLDTFVEEQGRNFSLGQRQLMALARALVRNSRIVVCDEATSSVDFATDHQIQQTMAEYFHGRTLICIAHRLRTILTYNRICVVDRGQVIEVDTPLKLWEKEDSIFRGMCEQSGIKREDFVPDERLT